MDEENYNLDRENTIPDMDDLAKDGKHQVLIAAFNKKEDVKKCLNEMVQTGYDTDRVSLIMNDNDEDVRNDNEEFVFDEPDIEDEENPSEETYGVIEPMGSVKIGDSNMNIPGIGSVVMTGPLSTVAENADLSADLYSTDSFEPGLYVALGVPEEHYTALEQRLKNDQIIIVLPLNDEKDKEMQVIIADNGPDFITVEEVDVK
jgi:hypothetical protein